MDNKYFILVHHPGASFALFNGESDLRKSMKLVILRTCIFERQDLDVSQAAG